MTRLDARLTDLLGPIRDAAVGGLLEAMARRLEGGAEVEAEPVLHDPSGRLLRSGPLALPRRGDLRVVTANRRLIERIESPPPLDFAPITLVDAGGFVTTFAPFRWDALAIIIAAGQPRPNWAPVRHWFLEWFQTRYADVAPDLAGTVHTLDGPEKSGAQWRIMLDLGSAPVDCISDLIGAFAATGAGRMHLGSTVD
ncbi:hypothetical protein H0I76_15360 [Limibaculum sp. M0105]|uniref:Uncharacterized protein n=1 Tax=Thermohalobaculum xanthum TaxID=2753746 RepID=A0A8J7SG40_9RHOB|nr:hypothetical protein [Thermohalobaculum xanthum]MBK0400576.1 hypothetical protein [Thermohalobaculum xanthum]